MMELEPVKGSSDHRRSYDISAGPVLQKRVFGVKCPTGGNLALSVANLEILAPVLTFIVFKTIITLMRWRSQRVVCTCLSLLVPASELPGRLILRSLILVG